jgi:3-isopropylmalate/(R)-2-methylmalate dehydratase small subunit
MTGTGIPVPGNDIDTDRIIPARFMKCVTFDGLGEFAFYDVRFTEDGGKKDHSFNDSRFDGGTILLVNKNFGCGSSREHAPQALRRYGIGGIIGESFAEIFRGNCTAMGIPAVTVSEGNMGKLMALVNDKPSTPLTIDLEKKIIEADGKEFPLDIPDSFRNALTGGQWDSTDILLKNGELTDRKAEELFYLHFGEV